MFGTRNKNIENEQKKYELRANEYLENPKKTDGLIKNAIKKANDKKGSLGEAWDKLQLLVDFIRSWANGDYRNVSKGTIAAVIGSVIYFVSPIDLVPDFIAGLGFLDDAAVIGFTLKKISGDLERYKEWKEKNALQLNNDLN
ncbi:MAG: YkvA family protein [Bacillota bacterium]|nr:YkvA family protein [Bacillota bacterium]